MKKMFLATMTAFLAFAGGSAWAQSKPYEDLLVKYVDEKYEDCLFKAERYTQNDKTKKDPLPYLYMSMCYFEMSKIPKYQEMEEYKKADRDALKWAEKYRKKDKDMEFFHNYEDFWASLNTMAQESGLNMYEAGPKELSKARRYFESMTRYYPENPGAWLMLALTQYKANQAKEADASVAQYRDALEKAGGIARLPEDQQKLMKSALIHYAEYLSEKGDSSGAREAMETGKEFFMDDPEYKGAYNSFH
ncbi:MAG: tetratricopeptide repeat protein [Flavobacteriales bacterium]|nr:tetratricopeptide repeat protein [Flavobacteriales bacterium]MEB2341564.1 tetratricopeptide repeat protein [Flavobacteriia bacterium]